MVVVGLGYLPNGKSHPNSGASGRPYWIPNDSELLPVPGARCMVGIPGECVECLSRMHMLWENILIEPYG